MHETFHLPAPVLTLTAHMSVLLSIVCVDDRVPDKWLAHQCNHWSVPGTRLQLMQLIMTTAACLAPRCLYTQIVPLQPAM